jgi:hypothetical protein
MDRGVKKLEAAAAAATMIAMIGAAAARDHPRLPYRALHVVSPAHLQLICPEAFACSQPDWRTDTCHIYVPNVALLGWPSRHALLTHELRHCDGRGQD